MKQVIERAPAKLNLFLEVGQKRDDGFHDIVSVMQTVSVMDGVTLTLREDGIFSLQNDKPYLPCDERNVALAAAKLFAETYGVRQGCHIDIRKGIPVTAGVGGGSADAAAVLRGMCRLYGVKASREELCKLGEQIGSDVPFCVAGGTALATGRGENLQALKTPELQIVFFRSGRKVSTAHAPSASSGSGSLRMTSKRTPPRPSVCGARQLLRLAKQACILPTVLQSAADLLI